MIGGSEGCLETTIGGASGCWFGAFLGREGRPVGRTCGMDILRSFGLDSVIGDGLWGVLELLVCTLDCWVSIWEDLVLEEEGVVFSLCSSSSRASGGSSQRASP